MTVAVLRGAWRRDEDVETGDLAVGESEDVGDVDDVGRHAGT